METREIRGLRNHPTYMLETSWGSLLVLVMIFINGADSWFDFIKSFHAGNKDLIYVLGIGGGVLAFFLLSLFFSFRIWRKTTITLADGSLTWEQNTIFSKKKEYSISNISNVNLEQNLFERIVGTYKLKIDTSSRTTANETDMKIILGKKDAFEVRDLLLYMMKHPEGVEAEKSTDSFAETQKETLNQEKNKDYYGPISDDGEEYDFFITPGENVKCALGGIKEGQLFWLIVIIVGLVLMFGIGLSHGQSLSGILASVIVLLSFGYSIAKDLINSFMRTYNYKVRREDDHIYITSGAIKIRSYSVPVKQIQAVRFQSTLLGRLMGRVSVSVINVSGEGEDVDGQWLFPPIEIFRIKELMDTILPEIPVVYDGTMEFRPKKCMVFSIIKTVLVIAILSIIAVIAYMDTPVEFYEEIGLVSQKMVAVLLVVILVAYFLIRLVKDVVRQSTDKMVLLEDRMAVRNGALSWQQIEIAYDKIQMLTVEENIIDRFLHVKRGRIHLLASMVASVQKIPEFDRSSLEDLQNRFRNTIR
ncbi:MAG: PH domain-containing protein [Lachnospiraceae bacterium]|nr:PH domain-containing protein [Lachnospiraceae bacterium]